ncbi:MAG: hypothetical protein H6736_25355, partial [Alphaproteobacteria bacterium]|nr:hypothetical protein [Alphaproteobacteria bacterium]
MHRVTVGLALLTLASVACGPHYRPFTQADLLHGGSVGGYDLSGPPPSDEALARRVSGGRETGFLELDRVGDDWVRAAGSGGELEVFYDHEGRPVAVLGVPRDADGYAVDLEGQPGTPSPVRLVGRGAGWGDLYATDQREVYLGIVDGSARYLMRVMDEEVFTNRWLGPVLRIDDLNTRARLAIASGDADEQVAILSTLDTFRSPDVEALAAEVRLALGSEVAQALDLAEGDTRTVHDRARGLAEVASALARAGGSAEDAQRLGALWDGLDGALAAEGEVAART